MLRRRGAVPFEKSKSEIIWLLPLSDLLRVTVTRLSGKVRHSFYTMAR